MRLVACGVCHTDMYTASGVDPSGYAPTVLGHEGAGRRRAVGADVTLVARGRPRGDPVLAPVRRVRPLRQPADEPLPGDPRAAEPRLPAGRDDAAVARRRAAAPLHGHLDVRRVHGDAGDRAGEDRPARRRSTARACSRAACRPASARRCSTAAVRRGLDVRGVRRRHGRARRGGRLPAAGRRADRVRRPVAGAPGARARPGRDRR